MQFITVLIAVFSLAVLMKIWSAWRRLARAQYIRTYMFPPGLFNKFAQQQPQLASKDRQMVARGLRQYFLAHLHSGCKFVSMPSQVVDDLWHEFILYTRQYDQFCHKAFGKFMHHTPAVVLGKDRLDNTGLRRTWWYCCLEENINPRQPTRLPLLFALDKKLNIANGFVYAPHCEQLRAKGNGSTYCGGDFGSSSFDGDTAGFGESGGSDSGFGFGDSGGGDGGCGGGCGGGD
jgi:hypothetical protein